MTLGDSVHWLLWDTQVLLVLSLKVSYWFSTLSSKLNSKVCPLAFFLLVFLY